MDALIREYDVANAQRHKHNEAAIKGVEVHQSHQDTRLDNHDDRLEALEREFLLRSTATSVPAANQQRRWDQKPDAATLRLNIHDQQLCTPQAIEKATEKWLKDAGFSFGSTAHLSGNGNSLASTWTIRFAGDELEGDRRARKAIQCLKHDDGTWEQLHVQLPNGQQARIYISPDKNDLQIKTEQSGKRLLEAARAIHPNLEWHLIRKQGIVTVGWDRVALAVPITSTNIEIQWLHETAARHQINKDAIIQKFDQISASSGVNLPWSV